MIRCGQGEIVVMKSSMVAALALIVLTLSVTPCLAEASAAEHAAGVPTSLSRHPDHEAHSGWQGVRKLEAGMARQVLIAERNDRYLVYLASS